MKDRIREVREHFGLSMEKFGSRIGIGKASISLLESGKNNPSVQTITLICREFGVNEQWLRTGEGEMFEQTRASVLDRLSTEYDLSREQRSVIEAFLDLDPQERDVILKYVHNVLTVPQNPQPRAQQYPIRKPSALPKVTSSKPFGKRTSRRRANRVLPPVSSSTCRF